MDHKILIKYLDVMLSKNLLCKAFGLLAQARNRVKLYKLTLFSLIITFTCLILHLKETLHKIYILRGLNYYSVLQNTGIV